MSRFLFASDDERRATRDARLDESRHQQREARFAVRHATNEHQIVHAMQLANAAAHCMRVPSRRDW